MFGLFQSKEKKQIKRLKAIAEEIEAAGGSQFVCDSYLEFYQNHELKEKIGLVPEDQSPFSKIMVMQAALMLLDIFKIAKIKISPPLINAQSAYVNTAFMATSEDLRRIYALIDGGQPIQKEILSKFTELNEAHKKAWASFSDSETPVIVDLFKNKKS
jgi:hypothetical protein